jgi:hypothetical protein
LGVHLKLRSPLSIEKFKIQVSERVIPTFEIAKLAAVLAYGRPIDSQNLAVIAAQAIELWEKCEHVRAKKIERLAIYARASAIKDATYINCQDRKNFQPTLTNFCGV